MAALFAVPAMTAAAQVGLDGAGASPCLAAAATAELEWGLPTGVLAAIGRVESGRWNPGTRRLEPWPWTANVAGEGRYYASKDEAIANVGRERAGGVRSVDVGCFQVNLAHHPNAFANLGDAFDPLANARYAGRFLTALHMNAGAWDAAIGQYHSALLQFGTPYRERVLAALEPPALTPHTSAPILRTSAALANPAWPAGKADPYVTIIRSALFLVRTVSQHGPSDPHVMRIKG